MIGSVPFSADDARFFAELRSREFSRLARDRHAYLDYTGSGLYGESQLRWHRDWLAARVLGNPHSENPASLAASDEIERVRALVFDAVGADPEHWELVFTANATCALKLVGEAFCFGPESRYVLAADNHNSVGGIREYARRAGAQVDYLPLDDELRLAPDVALPDPGAGPSLFAYPAQSNFSGVVHPLAWVETARARGYRVLLDTAAYAPTHALDLDRVAPDFACLSFYKMFGYPTGLGALLARREALADLRRPWYAGGTVDFVSIQNELHQLRGGGGAYEDGTPDFLGIAALEPGFDLLAEVGFERLSRWTSHLTGLFLDGLLGLRHADGSQAARVYGPTDLVSRGALVCFNLLDPAGDPVPYEGVEEAARDAGISLRGGCFCNPGAAEAAFDMPAGEMRRCLESMERPFSLARLRDCLGGRVAVGAVRASFGVASSEDDVGRALDLLAGVAART